MTARNQLEGQIFGRWKVLQAVKDRSRFPNHRRTQGALWIVECSCGRHEVKLASDLRRHAASSAAARCSHDKLAVCLNCGQLFVRQRYTAVVCSRGCQSLLHARRMRDYRRTGFYRVPEPLHTTPLA